MCEDQLCRMASAASARHIASSYECEHLQSTRYYTEPMYIELDLSILKYIVDDIQWVRKDMMSPCQARLENAMLNNIPAVVMVQFKSGVQPNWHFSVYEPASKHYSILQRTHVRFDENRNEWHCQCCLLRSGCIHKNMAKWCAFQNNSDLFKPKVADSKTDDDGNELYTHSDRYPPTGGVLKKMLDLERKHSKIPLHIPDEVLDNSINQKLIGIILKPTNTTCLHCGESQKLGDFKLISDHAKIITMTGVIQDISTYCRFCPSCNMPHRYNDWKEGLHNYNDKVIISLQFALHVRSALQQHTAISRTINSFKDTFTRSKWPETKHIADAYMHFESMTDHSYDFFCLECGYYPVILQADLTKKCVFDFDGM